MSVTRKEQQVMDELQAKVRHLLRRVEAVARPVERASQYLGTAGAVLGAMGPLGWLGGLASAAEELLANDAQKRAAAALREIADEVPRWMGPDGEVYRWAQQGRRDNGTPFSVAQWLELGNAIASSLAYGINEVHKASTLEVFEDTVDATAEELAARARDLADKVPDVPGTLWDMLDWKVKAGLIASGGVLALGATSLAWSALRSTPVGLALRGVGLVARAGVKPLGAAAAKATRATEKAIERAEGRPGRARGRK
jgi:hypothetical protein